jgi:hypothetical protein
VHTSLGPIARSFDASPDEEQALELAARVALNELGAPID